MTEEYRDMLVAKMLDEPSSLTGAELEIIAGDEELRGIYEVSANVESAYDAARRIDVGKEWQIFRPRIHRPRSATWWMARVAALFFGVSLVSGVVVRVVDGVFTPSHTPATVAKVEHAAAMPDDEPPVPEGLPLLSSPEAEAHPASAPDKVIAPAGAAPSSPGYSEPEESESVNNIDVDEYLRIQQARVDNDLALQNVEVMDERRAALSRMLGVIDGADDPDAKDVRTVIMQ